MSTTGTDMGDMWRDVHADSRKKRAKNRVSSEAMLRAAGIAYEWRANGGHLIIEVGGRLGIDFWPGTGLWIVRGHTERNRGVESLIKYVKQATP